MKKEYIEPEMKVIEMECQAALLDGSGSEDTEYDGEFGFAPTHNVDRLA